MWIFLNNSFMSAVEYRPPGMAKDAIASCLMVRARFRGDLERVFPSATVTETPAADYRFRCVVDRLAFADALAREVSAINYTNFKNSISKDEEWRHDTYLGVWSVMNREQMRQTPRPRPAWEDQPWLFDHGGSHRPHQPVRGSKRKGKGKVRGFRDEVETCRSCGTILQSAWEHDLGLCLHCEDLPDA